MEKLKAYIELTKPRILTLVVVTAVLGYYLGGEGINSYWILFYLVLGVSLTCAGASSLNHYLERETDSLMERTKKRPIPKGIIDESEALGFGLVLVLLGVAVLYMKVNLLTSFLSLLTAFLYVLVYTPLKRVSWLNTSIGAIPGAIPPMGGWAAATGELSIGAWVLFLILFFWQHPHFYAIAWMLKDDYKKANLKMLPTIEPDGASTFKQINFFAILLVPISLMPSFVGIAGRIYFIFAWALGVYLLLACKNLSDSHSLIDAKKLLKASVIYLPILLLIIILDNPF